MVRPVTEKYLTRYCGYRSVMLGNDWHRQQLTVRRFVTIDIGLLQTADSQALVKVIEPPFLGVGRTFVDFNDDGASVVEDVPELQEATGEESHTASLYTIHDDVTRYRLFQQVPTCCQLQFIRR
jgi:hypothetical protein